jgi:hypothetical protein
MKTPVDTPPSAARSGYCRGALRNGQCGIAGVRHASSNIEPAGTQNSEAQRLSFAAPSEKLGRPSSELRAPSKKLGWPSSELRAPRKTLGRPSKKLGQLSSELRAPSKKLGGPSFELRTPGKTLGGPSFELRTPGKTLGRPNFELRTPGKKLGTRLSAPKLRDRKARNPAGGMAPNRPDLPQATDAQGFLPKTPVGSLRANHDFSWVTRWLTPCV